MFELIKRTIKNHIKWHKFLKDYHEFDVLDSIPSCIFKQFIDFHWWFENGNVDWNHRPKIKKEIITIHNYIAHRRPKMIALSKKLSTKAYEITGGFKFIKITEGQNRDLYEMVDNNTPHSNRLCDIVFRLNERIDTLDSSYCKRIIDIRMYLWD